MGDGGAPGPLGSMKTPGGKNAGPTVLTRWWLLLYLDPEHLSRPCAPEPWRGWEQEGSLDSFLNIWKEKSLLGSGSTAGHAHLSTFCIFWGSEGAFIDCKWRCWALSLYFTPQPHRGRYVAILWR